ncbi:twin-arginine translocase subunit TatC [bacterium]|nr:twin-arginine translocase subunit TatC [bacterium]
MPLINLHEEKNLSFLEHLEELRARLLRSVVAIVIGCIVGYFLAPVGIDLLLDPIRQSGLLPKQDLTVQFEIQDDGQMKLLNPEIIPDWAVQPVDDGTTATAQVKRPEKAETRRITRIELHAPGSEMPFAAVDTVERSGVIYLRPMDPFIVRLKAALVLGILLALPYVLLQVYAFIAPGLLPHERAWAGPCYFSALVLFPIGAAFAYYCLKFALIFFAGFASDQAYVFSDIRAYLSFALTSMLVFGVLFELPLVVLLATRMGLVSVDTLAGKRKHIFVALLVVAAVVTPTADPFTFMVLTLPLYGLFEISLLLGRIADAKAEERIAEEEEETPEG